MANTTIPLMLEAVEQGKYDVIKIMDNSGQKIILEIRCNLGGRVYKLSRRVKDQSKLEFFHYARLTRFLQSNPFMAEFVEGIPLKERIGPKLSDNYSIERIFSTAEQQNPEYTRTNGS